MSLKPTAKRAAAAAARQPKPSKPPAPRGVWADKLPDSSLAKQLAAVRRELADLKCAKASETVCSDETTAECPNNAALKADKKPGLDAEVEKLKIEIEKLEGISGADALLAEKRLSLTRLQRERQEAKPIHQRLRDVQGKLDRKEKAYKRRSEEDIPELRKAAEAAQRALDKATASLPDLEKDILELKTDKERIQSTISSDAPVDPALVPARAGELLGKLKELLTGPGAGPFVQHLEQLEAQISKFHVPPAAGPLDVADMDVAEVERQVENCRQLAAVAEERLEQAKRAKADASRGVAGGVAPVAELEQSIFAADVLPAYRGPVPPSSANGSSPY